MQITQHIQQRMSQRGVSRDMVEFVLTYGELQQDKYVIGRRNARELLDAFERQMRVLKKILDKGGVTVVAEDGALITTYNCTGQNG